MTESSHIESSRRSIPFKIDGEPFTTHDPSQCASELLKLAGLDPNIFDLAELVGKERPETKSLSDNSGCTICYLSAGEMKHSQVVVQALLPPDQQPSEPVQPTVTALDHPAAGAVSRNGLFVLAFLASTSYVRCVSVARHQLLNLRIVIALVQTQPLRPFWLGHWTVSHNGLECWFSQLHIVAIGAVHAYSYRNAVAIGQQTALRTRLASVRRVWASTLTPRAEPSSWLHPLPATAIVCRVTRRIRPTRASIVSRRLRLSPNADSDHARYSALRTFEGWTSTGSRCATRRVSRPYNRGRTSRAFRPSDPSPLGAARARFFPKAHRACAYRLPQHVFHSWSCPSSI